MSRALKINSQPESDWTVIAGPLSGTHVHLNSEEFSIGRSQECAISLPNDPKISRKHARVYWSGSGFRIQSLVDQNPVLIQGRPISDESVNSGTIVQLGDTQIRFDGKANLSSVSNQAMPIEPLHFPGQFGPPQIPGPPQMSAAGPNAYPQRRTAKKRGPQTNNTKRFLIYAAVGGLLWFLLSPTDQKKEDPFAIRSDKQVEADIEEANQLRKMAEKSRASRLNPTLTERQAQEHYVKGFRDFRKGQYERSTESFQACLALSPDNALCNRYLIVSRKKFHELVQYHMVLGRKYRDQNQFRACRSSFKNVMVMVKDPSSAIYNEAKSNYDACNSLAEGRF